MLPCGTAASGAAGLTSVRSGARARVRVPPVGLRPASARGASRTPRRATARWPTNCAPCTHRCASLPPCSLERARWPTSCGTSSAATRALSWTRARARAAIQSLSPRPEPGGGCRVRRPEPPDAPLPARVRADVRPVPDTDSGRPPAPGPAPTSPARWRSTPRCSSGALWSWMTGVSRSPRAPLGTSGSTPALRTFKQDMAAGPAYARRAPHALLARAARFSPPTQSPMAPPCTRSSPRMSRTASRRPSTAPRGRDDSA